MSLKIAKSSSDAFPTADDSSWKITNDLDIEIKYRVNWKSKFDIPKGLLDTICILNSVQILKSWVIGCAFPSLYRTLTLQVVDLTFLNVVARPENILRPSLITTE
jgi:hypothetical protein